MEVSSAAMLVLGETASVSALCGVLDSSEEKLR